MFYINKSIVKKFKTHIEVNSIGGVESNVLLQLLVPVTNLISLSERVWNDYKETIFGVYFGVKLERVNSILNSVIP